MGVYGGRDGLGGGLTVVLGANLRATQLGRDSSLIMDTEYGLLTFDLAGDWKMEYLEIP